VVVVVVANNPPNRSNTMCLKTFLLRQLLLPPEPRSFGKLKDHQCPHCRVQFSQFLNSSSIACFLSLQFNDMQQSSNNSQCSSMQQLLQFQYKVQQRAAGGLFLAKMLWSNSEVYKFNNSNPQQVKSLRVVM
jgi:hypothetical protein